VRLGKNFADLRHELAAWHTHDWHSDPFARGAYSYVPVGNFHARRTLATPAENTLYFAGKATCFEGYSGAVHGAIRSGKRAAREILQIG
jgi:monoamine oxidase